MNSDSILNKLEEVERNLKDEIKASVQTKFLAVSPNVKDLVEIANEIWRMESRINKSKESFGEDLHRVLLNSFQRIKRLLEKNDLEVRDYTGQKYNSGLSGVDVISVEKDKKAKEEIIKETVEPSILLKGQIVKKAKVIIISNN